jgi:hypothetical protein
VHGGQAGPTFATRVGRAETRRGLKRYFFICREPDMRPVVVSNRPKKQNDPRYLQRPIRGDPTGSRLGARIAKPQQQLSQGS